MKYACADCPKELPSGSEPSEFHSFDELMAKQELHAQRSSSQVGREGPPDALVLFRSQVWEGVLPTGIDREFQKFYSAVSPAAERQWQNSAHFDNVAAAGCHSAYRRQEEAQEKARPHQPTLAEVCGSVSRQSSEDFQESSPESLVRHTVGQTPKSPRDFVGFKEKLCSWNDRLHQ